MIHLLQRWWFSLLLIPVYLGIFHLWMILPSRLFFVISGTLCALLLAGVMTVAWRRGYFASRVDLIAHALVVLDIWLEAVLITVHDHHGFYACALAFIITIGAYRFYALRQKIATTTTTLAET